jgi:hypothetical protein
VHHQTFQINQTTRCNNFSSLLLDVYIQLNMFRASSRPSSGAQQLQLQPLVLSLERGGSSAVGRGRASYNRPNHDQQHCYHQAPTVKPEAASAVVELLMMGREDIQNMLSCKYTSSNKLEKLLHLVG